MSYGAYITTYSFCESIFSNTSDVKTRNKRLNAELLEQGD